MSITRHTLLLEAATPVAHADPSSGAVRSNTRAFMRQGRLVDGVPTPCPHVSENALRHSLLREPLADHLLAVLDLERARLPRAVVNLLYSGGQMGGASMAADTVVLGHAVKRLYPSIDLLGGAVDAFILPRGRLRLGAWIVAQENAWALSRLFPDLDIGDPPPGCDLLANETRTRGTGDQGDGSNQMIYSYETLAAGARIAVELTLDSHAPPACAAALALAVGHAWDGWFGGQGRQGRGRMIVLREDLPDIHAYDSHIAAHADAMRDGLLDGTLGSGRVLCA